MIARVFVVFVLLAFITSCTEYRSLQRTEGSPTPYDFSIGDNVQLTTDTSGIVTLRITQITDSSLKGMDLRTPEPIEREIEFSDITQASTEKLNIGDTAKGAGISLVAIIAVIFAIAFATYGGA